MKTYPGLLLAFVLSLALTAFALPDEPTTCGGGSSGATGTPGVEDGTCWKNDSGDQVEADVKGTVHGDQNVDFTDTAGNTGSATGTPDPDGGCVDSSSAKVGNDEYRIKDGDVQFKNDNGDWVDMRETDCPPDKLIGGDDLGSLPLTSQYE